MGIKSMASRRTVEIIRHGATWLIAMLMLTGLAGSPFCQVASAAPSASTDADDDRLIGDLLATYQSAVSRKDQTLFETLLLGKDIPFAFVPANPNAEGAAAWRDYEGFRKGVFEGPAFTQTFSDVHIRRHGALADVDLVYTNLDAHGAFRAWKTMQLLKIAGRWRIASEFFTNASPR